MSEPAEYKYQQLFGEMAPFKSVSHVQIYIEMPFY